MEDEVRVRLRRVYLDIHSRGNGLFPKFVEVDFAGNKYTACNSPTELTQFPDGSIIYEPIDYHPYVFNQYYYSKKDLSTRLFYVAEPEPGSVTWGSYVVHFGTPLIFGY